MKKRVSQYDKMTATPIPRLVISLSIPSVISMLVTNVYNLVDTAFVGQLGNSASGAVGVVFGFMAILQAVGFMFGNGSGSIISRSLGSKDRQRASEIASSGFFGVLFVTLIISALSFVFLKPLVIFLGSTPTIEPYAEVYVSYILMSAPFITSSFLLNNILRYEGRAFLGMMGMLSGAVLNILGDAVFMFGFNMGVAGAGLSTALSQVVSFIILLNMFIRKRTETTISLKLISKKLRIYVEIITTGFPSMLRQGLNSIATVLLNNYSGVYGDEAVAAMSIVSRVIFFAFSVAIGIGQGFQPVCGFNYGAKKYDRVKKAFFFTGALAEGVVLIMSGLILFFFGNIIRIFRDDPRVIEIGTRALVLQALAQFALPFCMAVEMMTQSTGRRLASSLLSASRNGLFFIPLLIILANLRGLSGIQEAQPIAVVLSAIPAIIIGIRFFKKLNTE